MERGFEWYEDLVLVAAQEKARLGTSGSVLKLWHMKREPPRGLLHENRVGGRVYAMGDGFMPWRDLKVPVELEGTCGANLGWGRAEEGRKRGKEEKAHFTVPLDCGVYGGRHGGGIQIQSTYGGIMILIASPHCTVCTVVPTYCKTVSLPATGPTRPPPKSTVPITPTNAVRTP